MLLLLFAISASHAQQTQQDPDQLDPDEPITSKRGQTILPEMGDYALGFDAVPFLEYLGNIFNGTNNNTVGADFPGMNQQVFGKYFLRSNMAVRGRLAVDQERVVDRNRVILDNQPIPDPDVEVTDEWIENSTDVSIGGGVEYRKGLGRVVGVFGGEVSLMYRRTKIKYDYGNPITEGNQAPTSTFGAVVGGRFERIVEETFNRELGAGITGFAGVEYFVAPKMSIGAEFTLGLEFMKMYRGEDKFEFWNAATSSVETRSSVAAGGSELTVETGNAGGSINLMFYF